MSYHYDINRSWSDQFIPEIKRIVGAELLRVASADMDRTEATDLVMLDARDMRIAARVRRPGYAERYPHQFTIRSALPSGAPTELNKIVNGYGDWMFYGHSDERGRLANWWLIDLRAFRAALIRRDGRAKDLQWGTQTNQDGTSFMWFDLRSFPVEPQLVVASRQTIEAC